MGAPEIVRIVCAIHTAQRRRQDSQPSASPTTARLTPHGRPSIPLRGILYLHPRNRQSSKMVCALAQSQGAPRLRAKRPRNKTNTLIAVSGWRLRLVRATGTTSLAASTSSMSKSAARRQLDLISAPVKLDRRVGPVSTLRGRFHEGSQRLADATPSPLAWHEMVLSFSRVGWLGSQDLLRLRGRWQTAGWDRMCRPVRRIHPLENPIGVRSSRVAAESRHECLLERYLDGVVRGEVVVSVHRRIIVVMLDLVAVHAPPPSKGSGTPEVPALRVRARAPRHNGAADGPSRDSGNRSWNRCR